ncbi:MAG TPA: tRNA pseudouridine(13) synthase TruD [Luteimonas sp.]|nr:tRNA pseudouridine(13) synthase TruD [Luteimonas sp.]
MSDVQPRAHGPAVLSAVTRTTPEDFIVEEIDGFEASGSGEHLLLTIEKRGMNTAFAAKRIAQWADLPEMAVSYAGLKDRHAVTRQRFSVHLPKRVAPDIASLQIDDLRVLKSEWHAKKLPRGALAGNRFVLTLREVQGERADIEARLQAIAARGVPNYFGEQRFGRDGDNLGNALAMFGGRRVGREQRGYLLSAARSALFNRVLAARASDGSWERGLNGEVWMLDGSRSVFGPEPWNDALAARLAAFDIHPTAPLWGRGELRTTDAARELEQAALADDESLALRAGLEAAGLKQERRATRLRPLAMTWEWGSGACVLGLRFALPPGTYATTVLAELGDTTDAAGGRSDRSSEKNAWH